MSNESPEQPAESQKSSLSPVEVPPAAKVRPATDEITPLAGHPAPDDPGGSAPETTAGATAAASGGAASGGPNGTGTAGSGVTGSGVSGSDAAGDAAPRPRIEVGSRHAVGPRPSGDRPLLGGGAPPAGGSRAGSASGTPASGTPAEGTPAEGLAPRGDRQRTGRPPRGGKPRREGGGPRREGGGPRGEGGSAEGAAGSAGATSDIPRANIPVPSKRDGLSPELEAELNEALGGMSLDQFVEQGLVGRAVQTVEQDTRARGTVMRITGDNVFVSLGGRNEGVISLRQFKEPPALGSELDVVVKSFHAEDGLYDLIVPGASIDVADWSDLTQGAVVEARITGANTGGLECMVNNIRGFIPASQVALFRVENFGDYINQKLACVVTEVNPRRKNLVLSHRALLEREKEETRKEFLAQLAPGQIYEGVVRKIQDFGVFVDIGGVDGLVHVSQLSWDRVNHPSEVVQEGQKIRVKVEKFNEQTGKISLSHRDLLERPWDHIEEKFPVGVTVKGTVSRIAKFGAFVKLAPGIEGLIHISELAHGRVRRVEDVLKEGQDVEVKVLSVDAEAQRMALSYKATLPPPAEQPAEAVVEEEEAARAPAVPRRNRPLRGGFDRPTGGDHFGLKW